MTILITGAAGALGSIVAKKFFSSGCEVIATDFATPADPQKVRWIPIDLSKPESVHTGLAQVGAVDGLVHCAGGFRFSKLEETSDRDFNFLIQANLSSTFYLLRELLPGMKKRNFGRIVVVSARATLQPPAGMSAYAASKAGLNALVASVAEEVKSFNININAVLPTILDTPANRHDMPKADFSTWVKTEELAEIIYSLTQPWGKPVNGALIPVVGRA